MPRSSLVAYNSYQRTYQLARYHRRRAEAIAFLGGRCAECGATADLEIGHIDPAVKLYSVSRFWSIREELFWAEICKCQLLCHEHHLEKTRQEHSVGHGGGASGRKNCPCVPCKRRKAEYMASYQRKGR